MNTCVVVFTQGEQSVVAVVSRVDGGGDNDAECNSYTTGERILARLCSITQGEQSVVVVVSLVLMAVIMMI